MNLHDIHVIVVGGAIGGASAALLLARAGATVTLLERIARPRAVGAGIGIASNGMAVLESLGLRPALAPHMRPVQGSLVDGNRRPLLSTRAAAPEIFMIRRSDLHEILLDALAAEPRIVTRFGAEVVDAGADGSVRVRSEGGEETLHADLVIAADGVNSRVRASGDFGASVSSPGIPYLRALVPEGLALNEEAWTSEGIFGSFSVDGATYVYASATSEGCKRAIDDRDLGKLRRAWAAAYAPAEELLGHVGRWEELLLNNVIRVDCDRWSNGRIVLLGDAAHAMAPNLGQGANSALVDAAVLLDELRRAPDVATALVAYEARRKPAVRRVADTAARLGALAESRSPIFRWLRDHVLMPIANMLASEKTNAMVMQESRETLLAIGQAPA